MRFAPPKLRTYDSTGRVIINPGGMAKRIDPSTCKHADTYVAASRRDFGYRGVQVLADVHREMCRKCESSRMVAEWNGTDELDWGPWIPPDQNEP